MAGELPQIKSEITSTSALVAPASTTGTSTLWDVRWSRTDAGLKAEERIKESLYDLDEWATLINEAKQDNIDRSRVLYERLVQRFPTSGRYWRIYIEHEMRSRNYDRVEQLFQRSLLKVLSLDLCKTYLDYVRETKGTLPTFRDKMTQAYEFALEKVGLDFTSIAIWMDYIMFLRSGEVSGSYAENQKITAVRKVYQRAVATPMINTETVWKSYSQFEQSTNQIVAKKLLDEKSRDYVISRRVAKEYEAVTRGLMKGSAAVPPTGSSEELQQLAMWKKYIQWEKDNPMHTDDASLLAKRVWCEATAYLESVSKLMADKGDLPASKVWSDDTSNLYERAITALPACSLLYCTYADFEEMRMKHDKVHGIYTRFLEVKEADPTLAYIQYMRFARRAEGIKAARTVFKKARDDTRTKGHVYVAAALMEYYCTKDKNISLKIFELGLKKYASDSDYCVAYVEFLTHLNEDNNTRVLFERILSSLPPEKSGVLLKKFLEFETNVGDLASVLKVEKRRSSFSAKEELRDQEAINLVDRYKYMGLWPCKDIELRSMSHPEFVRGLTISGPTTLLTPWRVNSVGTEEMSSISLLFPRPDLSQMRPFKPTPFASHMSHLAGGVFPPPPAVAELISKLPPPSSYEGPFVNVDDLMRIFMECRLREPLSGLKDGMLEKTKQQNGTHEKDETRKGRKRGAERDESDEEGGIAPPAKDIYRARQQRKATA
ncbi:cleavage stimulation factor subunit 3-like isoform X2 [Corticium candelabrum]|uniref:cleavage stimulation factor subunit 3-like isoform X2 n=1 Tax=Corticium candelabrum TaxID=121492 RepID=UPI002E357C83|nr:cleavage stimulation factor subunit 3-like isoform X2 [Corticium candelabrum]